MCMELTLEPFTFTQKKIINIETAFMQCFIVALALGDDEICCFKQFPCFLLICGSQVPPTSLPLPMTLVSL